MIWVDNVDEFKKMVDYFEEKKPNIIGLDCEWKPMCDMDEENKDTENSGSKSDESDEEVDDDSTTINSKNKRPNVFQIATREKIFIVEFRDLPDLLDESLVDRFASLVFFSDDIIKLGYGFKQDSKHLINVFSKFKQKFPKFVNSVINLYKVIKDLSST